MVKWVVNLIGWPVQFDSPIHRPVHHFTDSPFHRVQGVQTPHGLLLPWAFNGVKLAANVL
jgi:hypothetical protein